MHIGRVRYIVEFTIIDVRGAESRTIVRRKVSCECAYIIYETFLFQVLIDMKRVCFKLADTRCTESLVTTLMIFSVLYVEHTRYYA